MESVQQMALQLINQHQDIEALMLEVGICEATFSV